MRQYKYLGRYNQRYNQKTEDIIYDQNKCIFQPKLEEYLADTLLEVFDMDKLNNVNITSEMVLDSFKLFYDREKEVVVKPELYWFHHFLNKCDNHILSMVTNDNPGFSYIAASAVTEVLYNYLAKENPKLEDLNDEIKNGGGPNLDQLNQAAKKALNKAKKNIQTTQDSANQFGCSKDFGKDLSSAQMLNDSRLLQSISINGNELAKFVKYVIDKAVSYNTGKKYTVEESIFDSDDIEDIANVQNFSHVALLNDLNVIENKYVMNFDIFIDDSGSMGCRYPLGGKKVELRILARMIAFKMHAMRMVKDLWLFSCTRELYKVEPQELFVTKIDGGTDISQCIRQSNKTDRPCLIITDGDDYLDEKLKYNDKAYILALEVGSLSHTWKEYADNNQVLFYSNREGFRQGVYIANDWKSVQPVGRFN